VGQHRPAVNRLLYLVAWLRVAYLDWKIRRSMQRLFGLTPEQVRDVLARMPLLSHSLPNRRASGLSGRLGGWLNVLKIAVKNVAG
jgi:hypothetical protein